MKILLIKPSWITVALLGSACAYVPMTNAAVPVDLGHQVSSRFQSILNTGIELKETKRIQGKKNLLHVRLQQTYAGYPVYGADAILHVPGGMKNSTVAAMIKNSKAFMNGMICPEFRRH